MDIIYTKHTESSNIRINFKNADKLYGAILKEKIFNFRIFKLLFARVLFFIPIIIYNNKLTEYLNNIKYWQGPLNRELQ